MLEDINWRYLQVAESLKDERKIFIIDANMSRDDVFEQVRIILDREL
jgi:thymidylate kinase